MGFMFLFFVSPVGYGWGYRGWGPPYPRYVQRRRGLRATAASGTAAPFDHHSWGLAGDLVWMFFVIGMIWVVAAFWWR